MVVVAAAVGAVVATVAIITIRVVMVVAARQTISQEAHGSSTDNRRAWIDYLLRVAIGIISSGAADG